MRNLFLALSSTLLVYSATAADTPKTILFIGDSITAQGGYVRAIDASLKKTDAEAAPRVVSRGKASETVSGLSEAYHPGVRPLVFKRLPQLLRQSKPDWVVACYGINCAIYHPFDATRLKAYQEGMERLIKEVHASGAKLILLTAPPYAKAGPAFPEGTTEAAAKILLADANAEAHAKGEANPKLFGYRTPYPYYDEVMAQYATWLLTLNTRENVWVVDLRTPMLPKLKETHGRDPIHPNGVGHQVMADAFLAAWTEIQAPAK